jgi:hypothetical protein
VKKTVKVLSWVVPLAIMATLGVLLAVILAELDAGDQEREAQHAEIVALQAGLDEANKRLTDEGAPTVDVPEVEEPERGSGPPVVPPIPVGPTNAQMDAALERYCATHDCVPGPTRAQVAEALAELCSEIRCRGADGEDSTVPGPPPTAEQIDAAQARYCDAHNECRGPAGENGTDGANGEPGRGLLSMQCATGGWIITYSDGLGEPDPGPCRGPQGEKGEKGDQGDQGEKGEPGKDSTVPGPPGTARPGTYACPDGEYATGFTVADDGAVTLSCQAPTPPVIGPPVPTPTPTPEEN